MIQNFIPLILPVKVNIIKSTYGEMDSQVSVAINTFDNKYWRNRENTIHDDSLWVYTLLLAVYIFVCLLSDEEINPPLGWNK